MLEEQRGEEHGPGMAQTGETKEGFLVGRGDGGGGYEFSLED